MLNACDDLSWKWLMKKALCGYKKRFFETQDRQEIILMKQEAN